MIIAHVLHNLINTKKAWPLPEAPCPVDSHQRAGAAGRVVPGSFVQSLFSFWLYMFHYPAGTPLHRELRGDGKSGGRETGDVRWTLCIHIYVSFPDVSVTWEGFGAWFGGKASCPDHLHLQLAFLVHQPDLNITCGGKETCKHNY